MLTLSAESLNAVFAMPASDGAMEGVHLQHLRQMGRTRPVVLLAFPPKAAGTFFRKAVCHAVNGALVRTVHAQGGRDAQLYLPTFIAYYSGNMPEHVMVGHVHMQALPANIHFLDAFDIRPIIMMRSIPDMLASYWDMLRFEPASRAEGLNCLIPPGFEDFEAPHARDFLIDMLAPWYASYFATWLAYAARERDKVCVLHYRDFKAEPAEALDHALEHAGVARPLEVCEAAIARAWAEREGLRFNQGERGRGRSHFEPQHLARLERMLRHYPNLMPHLDELLGRGAFAAASAA